MSNSIDFGVQSWCFRHFKDNATVAKKVRSIGLNMTELCGVYADFNKPEQFQEVVDTYKTAGVSIISIGVQTFEGNDVEKSWFECASIAGAKHISAHLKIDSYVKAIAKIKRWSQDYGIKVGIHCHGGYQFGGSPDVLDHFFALGGPEIGLCIDTAWAMQIGPGPGNPVEWARRYAGRIYGIHFKDFVFERNGQWNDVVVGTGSLDLPAFAQAILDGGFDGMAVIEYEADVENPDAALKKCVDSMRTVLK
jgi:sugar phosphate isomerase/epimerase